MTWFAWTTSSPAAAKTSRTWQPSRSFDLVEQDICRPFELGKMDYVFNLASPASPVDYLEHGIETLQVGSQGTMNCLDSRISITPSFCWRRPRSVMAIRWSIHRKKPTGAT